MRDSLTTVRREIIESIISVDVKTKIDQLQNDVSRLAWEKEQQKQELRHIMGENKEITWVSVAQILKSGKTLIPE